MAARMDHLILAAVAAATASACARNDTLPPEGPEGGAVTVWTDSTELFMEYPALIVGAPDKFNVHLTDLTDHAPLRSGRITLRFAPRDGGAPVIVTQEVPRAPGIYGPEPAFARAGTWDLTIIVESPQARDSISVPGLVVYAAAADVPAAEGGGAATISFLKEQQWRTPEFRTAFADSGVVSETFEAQGEIVPAAGRFAVVSAPIAGLVDQAGIARSPVEGARVERGQVLGYLVPSLGEGGSAYARARAELAEAEDEHERARRLVAAEAAPERRLHEAEIRLRGAREALAGLGAGGLTADGRLPVTSPLSGVVAERSLVPGRRVEPGAPLFTIVDASRVWLRVQVPADRAGSISTRAAATFEAGDARATTARVISVGTIIDSVSRTLPVIYEVANGAGTIRIGAVVQARVRTGRSVRGVVLPAAAILEEDGRPIAYVQAEGEAFEKRSLTIGARDDERVLVTGGVGAGERVVIGAAYQVRLASLSTSVPAHGHEH